MTEPSERAIPNAFCARCHDAAPPADVVLPGGLRQIEPAFSSQPHGDGERAYDGWFGPRLLGPQKGRTLGTPNNLSLACATCHDPHGSPNWAGLRDEMNGRTDMKPLVRNAGGGGDTYIEYPNQGVMTWCATCHAGGMEGMIGSSETSCWSCHTNHSGDSIF